MHWPPRIVHYALLSLLIETPVRVFMPLLDMMHYRLWIAGSQVLWILAFGAFLLRYFPFLVKPRIDGQPG